jgi:hypothetical protein
MKIKIVIISFIVLISFLWIPIFLNYHITSESDILKSNLTYEESDFEYLQANQRTLPLLPQINLNFFHLEYFIKVINSSILVITPVCPLNIRC